jgi:cell division protein FtsW (lipid II flippase)
MLVTRRVRNQFGRLAAMGVAGTFSFDVFVNIATVKLENWLPRYGLPFVWSSAQHLIHCISHSSKQKLLRS